MRSELLANVSRETSEKLDAFSNLVLKWTRTINLISRSTVSHIWDRHILDSAQLYEMAGCGGRWVDLGSGGGFPGLVVSIMAQDSDSLDEVVLVESDNRKAVFLRTAIRELDLNASVVTERIENIAPLEADILSARALADLPTLIGFADRHLLSGGTALFHKGAQWEKEDMSARQLWSYKCDPVRSKSNPGAAILKIKDITRV